MIGVTGRLTTTPIYSALVSASTVREALNFEDTVPSPLALLHRIEEAAQRIEGLTRLCLPESVWEYTLAAEGLLNADFRPDTIFLAGLFAVGAEPSVAVTDPHGQTIPVTSTVRGSGDMLQIESDRPFREHGFPVKIVLTRGGTDEQLPGDLRAAIITQIEQLVDGFSSMAEASIIRTCARWG